MRRIIPAVLAFAFLALTGCDNVQTEPGKATYLYKKAFWYRAASFQGAQIGPTSTGFVWQMSHLTFEYLPKTYAEKFEILVDDDINVSFEASVRIGINTDEHSVSELVEGWGPDFYENIVKESFRSIVREVVGGYESRAIRTSRQVIRDQIKEKLVAELAEYEKLLVEMNPDVYAAVPITVQEVNVDNLDYPQALQTAISRTRELEKQLERKETEIEIAKKDKTRMVMEAESIAKRNRTIAGSLDDEYITYYAIAAAKKIARSQCPTVVIIPTDPAAPGVPFVRSSEEDKRKDKEKQKTAP
ncbi:hypothetical protein HQ560_06690 [bacterium]|nr:hypothetical protein [bacterium]